MLKRIMMVLPVTLLFPLSAAISGPAESPLTATKLVVGTKEARPFSMKESDGSWTGLSIELWRQIASELQLKYEFKEMDLPSLIQGLKEGSVDVGVAAMTVTEKREESFDFTHPFYSAGLGIAYSPRGGGAFLALLEGLFSKDFLVIIGFLVSILFLVGIIVWFFERRKNPEHFGGGPGRGIWSAFWWSAVTMTTVGYGDKAPVSFGGRLLAIVWMFAGIILISMFTAAITTILTVGQLRSPVRGPDDLPRVRVATVQDTTSEEFLERRRIGYRPFPSVVEALRSLASGEVDAVVYDDPILRYSAATQIQAPVRILPTTLERQNYALGLKPDSPLREKINRVLLRITQEDSWRLTRRSYLGD